MPYRMFDMTQCPDLPSRVCVPASRNCQHVYYYVLGHSDHPSSKKTIFSMAPHSKRCRPTTMNVGSRRELLQTIQITAITSGDLELLDKLTQTGRALPIGIVEGCFGVHSLYSESIRPTGMVVSWLSAITNKW
jgi:hypothetical protein